MAKIETVWYSRSAAPTPLGIAARLGWLEQEGVFSGVNVRSLQNEADPTLLASHWDHTLDHSLRQGGNVPAIWARARGGQTRLIGLTWTDEAQLILVRPDSPVKSVAELVGKRLGVAKSPEEPVDFWRATTIRGYVAALHAHGLSAHDVTFVELPRATGVGVRPLPSQHRGDVVAESDTETRALMRGEVDAIFHKGARGLELAFAIGARILYNLGDHPDPKVRVNNGSPRTLTVDAGFIRRDLPLVSRLLKRVILAGRWAETHPLEAVSHIAKEARASEHAVRRAYGHDINQRLKTDLDEPSLQALADFTAFLHRWQFIPNNVNVREWVDPRPLLLALESLSRQDGPVSSRRMPISAPTLHALS
jgi:ABC-type nitrate/sulfonate/bicarbonate transport system substrate-binding protein